MCRKTCRCSALRPANTTCSGWSTGISPSSTGIRCSRSKRTSTSTSIGTVLGTLIGKPLTRCASGARKPVLPSPGFSSRRAALPCAPRKPERVMCGITGVVHVDGSPVSAPTIGNMTATLAHRGPDGEGIWIDGPVGLGNRRLAIIDLSPSGHQPMGNETGDVVIVYNGELYNFQKLRVELESAGHRFHSDSDTEVVVHAYEEWGEECLDRFNGHFAFAIWDNPRKRLFLARDRFGVKPLYYHYNGARLLFGSEIKAILAYPEMRTSVCYEALSEYFTFQNVLTDLTLFDGVKLLPAGCSLTLDLCANSKPVQRRYWDFEFASQPRQFSEADAAEELYHLFSQAVT